MAANCDADDWDDGREDDDEDERAVLESGALVDDEVDCVGAAAVGLGEELDVDVGASLESMAVAVAGVDAGAE